MNSPEAYNHNSFLLSALHQFSHSIFTTSPSAKCWYYSHCSDEDIQGSERLSNFFRFTMKGSDRSGVSSGKMESIHGACNLHFTAKNHIWSEIFYGSTQPASFFFFLLFNSGFLLSRCLLGEPEKYEALYKSQWQLQNVLPRRIWE